jgi:PAS domain S-box-containing protein
MLQGSAILLLSLGYLGLLFAIAHLGDRLAGRWYQGRSGATIYALSLAIYCTSWTFYGSVGRAAASGPDFILIYVGPILAITLGYPVMAKMVGIAKRQNVTSIADFIGSRYGKSRAVAVLVTLIAVIGVLPYIALQLQAVSVTFEVLVGSDMAHLLHASLPPPWRDTAMFVAGIMGLFTILFGMRHVQATEQHRGMMLAIAFESLVKLAAFLAVGAFVVFGLFDSGIDLFDRVRLNPALAERIGGSIGSNWIFMTLLSGFAFLCLPRQFHVAVVENGEAGALKSARWLFPAYLVAINLFVVPIAAAGLLVMQPGDNPDVFVITIPMMAQQVSLSVFAFIGGLSAATSMVIVACMALSIMVSNELVTPMLLRSRAGSSGDIGRIVLNVRRAAVIVVLAAAYIYHTWIAGYLPLASIGMISFCAVANFAPPLLLGLYWRRAHRHGVIAGLVAGFAVWLHTLLLPSIEGAASGTSLTAPLGHLMPHPVSGFDPILQGFVASLLVNTALLVLVSLIAPQRRRDTEQAEIFVAGGMPAPTLPEAAAGHDPRIDECRALAARFIGSERADRAFAGRQMTAAEALAYTEHLLSGAIGAASARIVMASAQGRNLLSPRAARAMLDDASEAIRQNLDLLRTTLDHVSQGIGVFDRERRLLAWNDRFLDLLGLSPAQVQNGAMLEALAGDAGSDLVALLAPGGDGLHIHERVRADGRVIEIRIDPMPDGGCVATCTDISERMRTAAALRSAYEGLERRVAERTAELQLAVQELDHSRQEAVAANLGKTRFLAAASHDLLQPLHAARLFAAALAEREPDNPLVSRIDHGLAAVELLLDALLDISKLDAGAVKPDIRPVALGPLLDSIVEAFAPLAARRGVDIRLVPTAASVSTDPALLRRVLQNFVANAIRYARDDRPDRRVLIGCRRAGDRLRIAVCDNGPGIPADKRRAIFQEFTRLERAGNDGEARGLGLGLAIVERIARTLNAPVGLDSVPGRGAVFSVTLPRASAEPIRLPVSEAQPAGGVGSLAGSFILCIENEAGVRDAMTALLEGWSCMVAAVGDVAAARQAVAAAGRNPDIVLADLHLDEGGPDGLAAIAMLRQDWSARLPAILITADRSQDLRRRAAAQDVDMLHKPVRPAALRALISQRRRPPSDADGADLAAAGG